MRNDISISRIIARRMAIIALGITLISILVVGLIDYQRAISRANEVLDQVQATSTRGLEASLWELNGNLLRVQVDGITRNPSISYAAVIENGHNIAQSGRAVEEESSTIQRHIPLYHEEAGQKTRLGELLLVVDLWPLTLAFLIQLLQLFIIILIIIGVLGVAFFSLFERLVGRHLVAIASHLSDESFINESTQSLKPISSAKMGKELSTVVDSINDMHRQIYESLLELKESESRFRAYFERSIVGMATSNSVKHWIIVNHALCEILGYSSGELKRRTWAELTYPDDLAAELAQFNRLLVGEIDEYTMDKRFIRSDGSIATTYLAVRAVRKPDASLDYAVMLIEDIAQRKRSEESLRLASLVYSASSEGMLVTDAGNSVIAINPAGSNITGYGAEEVIGKNPHLFSSGRHDKAFFQGMWETLKSTGRWKGEIWNRRKNGDIYPERLSINTIYNADGSVNCRVSLFADITQDKKNDEIIWKQANFDFLTGLPNRRTSYDRLEQAIKKSNRMNLPLALLFIDLDQFKEVNDTLGHEAGDILLIEAARRMTSCVREYDVVGRLGGDEFTIILGELDDINRVEKIAENILEKLSAPYQLGVETVYLSASIGITLYPEDGDNVPTLFKNADQAMYSAKGDGRNRFHYFTPSMQEAIQNRMQLSNDLRTALTKQQFEIHYQPIIELATHSIVKAEALIRWQNPNRGLVSPADFIPISEEMGLIVEIGDWVFRQAAAQVAQWRALYQTEFQISINMSPVQFKSNFDNHAGWTRLLKELNLSGQSIAIEITEGLLVEASEAVISQLLSFRDNGIQVAIDDFGTGYSSLAYLKKFDIDYLKIDRSFVSNLGNNADDVVLCAAIIGMAHKLGIKVIAEGVETNQQSDLLKEMGCDYGQGYLFSKAVPAAEFEMILARSAETEGQKWYA